MMVGGVVDILHLRRHNSERSLTPACMLVINRGMGQGVSPRTIREKAERGHFGSRNGPASAKEISHPLFPALKLYIHGAGGGAVKPGPRPGCIGVTSAATF